MKYLSPIYSHRWSPEEMAAVREVWRVLVSDFFQRFVRPEATIMDLGAGFCHFINAIKAARKIAFDANPEIRNHADPEVEVVISNDLTFPQIRDGELTHVFMSNFLEHLPSSDEVLNLLSALKRKLGPDGSLLILQPNFRYTGAAYFDFIDHHVVLTDRSLVEALESTGYRIEYLARRFLPYTSKSRLPKSPALVRLYLKLPILWKLFGQQTFVVAVNSRTK